jgi:hypothetical protein
MNEATGKARAPAAPQIDPAVRRSEMRKAFFKFAVGCLLTMIMGGIVMKIGVLTTSATMIIVTVQITAFVIYFTTSDIMVGYHPTADKPAQRDALGPETRANRRRTGIRFVTFMTLAIIGVASFQRFGILAYPYPWKVIDPASKLFHPEKFAFTDYRTRPELEHAAQVLFPTGTPKTTVDWILHSVGQGSVEVYQEGKGFRILSYTYSTSSSRGFLPGVFAWVMNNREADKTWYLFMKYNTQNQVIGISGTVKIDDSGAMAYTQMTPTGTTSPYAPPTALQLH